CGVRHRHHEGVARPARCRGSQSAAWQAQADIHAECRRWRLRHRHQCRQGRHRWRQAAEEIHLPSLGFPRWPPPPFARHRDAAPSRPCGREGDRRHAPAQQAQPSDPEEAEGLRRAGASAHRTEAGAVRDQAGEPVTETTDTTETTEATEAEATEAPEVTEAAPEATEAPEAAAPVTEAETAAPEPTRAAREPAIMDRPIPT